MTASVFFNPWVAGFLLGCIAAGLAWAFGALNWSGALAAAFLGTLVFSLGGLDWAAILLTFFITSSLLSLLPQNRKPAIREMIARGEKRVAIQVLANGGIPGLCVIWHALNPASPLPWLGFTASLAAANADTWATELGILSPTLPRSIATGHPVLPGTSGGVSWVGTLAALAGSWLVCWVAGMISGESMSRILILTGCGLIGSLVDSGLGATVQAVYHCPVCEKETEKHPRHSCGTPTLLIRGWKWLNNDWVNGFCTLSAAMLGIATGWLR